MAVKAIRAFKHVKQPGQCFFMRTFRKREKGVVLRISLSAFERDLEHFRRFRVREPKESGSRGKANRFKPA